MNSLHPVNISAQAQNILFPTKSVRTLRCFFIFNYYSLPCKKLWTVTIPNVFTLIFRKHSQKFFKLKCHHPHCASRICTYSKCRYFSIFSAWPILWLCYYLSMFWLGKELEKILVKKIYAFMAVIETVFSTCHMLLLTWLLTQSFLSFSCCKLLDVQRQYHDATATVQFRSKLWSWHRRRRKLYYGKVELHLFAIVHNESFLKSVDATSNQTSDSSTEKHSRPTAFDPSFHYPRLFPTYTISWLISSHPFWHNCFADNSMANTKTTLSQLCNAVASAKAEMHPYAKSVCQLGISIPNM